MAIASSSALKLREQLIELRDLDLIKRDAEIEQHPDGAMDITFINTPFDVAMNQIDILIPVLKGVNATVRSGRGRKTSYLTLARDTLMGFIDRDNPSMAQAQRDRMVSDLLDEIAGEVDLAKDQRFGARARDSIRRYGKRKGGAN